MEFVTLKALPKEFRESLKDGKQPRGPIALRHKNEIIGFFIGRDEYEAQFGDHVRKLLAGRAREKSISQQKAETRARKFLRRLRRKV
jgi:hypothetical protein